MEDNQIYSIQLLENEGITPSKGGGQDKTYCPTKQEFIDYGFSKSGYDLSIDNIIAINQLIPKTALTETASVIKFDINPISLYPCSDWCALDDDGINEVTPSASTNGLIVFSGVSSVISNLTNGVAASIELCTNKNDINGTLIDNFEWHFYSADTFTVDGEEWVMGYIESVLPQNKTNENKTYYLVLNYQYNTPGDQSIFEIVQSKYWEPPYWDYDSSGNFPHSVPKAGGTYTVSIKDPYNIGWFVDENSQYNISEKSGTGDTSFSIRIPKATSVEYQTGSIYGYRPKIDLADAMLDTSWDKEGYVNIYDIPSTANCMGYADYCINVYQHGLDKPSWNYSASTLPYKKQYEDSYSSSLYSWLYYYVKVTNSDNIKWKCEMPYWLTLRDESYLSNLITSGGTKIYSGYTSSSSFGPKLTQSAYLNKSHYDGTMKFYYQDNGSSEWNLIDSKSITKVARPYMETKLDLSHGNISWEEQEGQIIVTDSDYCGYSLAISGDSNYSAWTSAFSPIQEYSGGGIFNITKIPQNLTDNDIEGYLILRNTFGNGVIEALPFKQECYKLTIYFTGQGFGKDTGITSDYCYLRAVLDYNGYEPGDDEFMDYSFLLSSAYNFTEQSIVTTVSFYEENDEYEQNFLIDYLQELLNGDTMSLYLTDEQGGQGYLKASGTTSTDWEPIYDALNLHVSLTITNPVSSTAVINTDGTPRINVKWDLATAKIINNVASSFTFTVSDSGQTGYKLSCSSWITCQYANGSIYRGTNLMRAFYSENSGTTERNGYITLMNSAGTAISKCIITQSGASKTFTYYIEGAVKQAGDYYILNEDYKKGATVLMHIMSNTSWTIDYSGKGWTSNITPGGGTFSNDKTVTFYLNENAVTSNDWENLSIEIVGGTVHDFINVGP